MKIIIFGGFLGSGKTTLIISLAKYLVKNKNKVVIIENEVGQSGIDNLMISSEGLNVRGIFGGCICCQLTVNLIETIEDIEKNISPEFVIIESTGLALPSTIEESINKYCDFINDIKTVSVVDCFRWEKIIKSLEELLIEQVKKSDFIFLNKIDKVDELKLLKLTNNIQLINEKSSIYTMTACKDDLSTIWMNLLD